MSKPDPEALRNSLEPPPAIPRSRPSEEENSELRRLRAELEELKRSRAEPRPSTLPPAAPTASSAASVPVEMSMAEQAAERMKIKLKLYELLEKLQMKRAAPPEPAPMIDSAAMAAARPVDRLRMVQNLMRSGQVMAAQRALQVSDPSSYTGRQAVMAKYLAACCHRRQGQWEEARRLYGEVAASREDEFLAECATWQLQAIQTRLELTSRLDTTRLAGPSR